MPIPPIYLNQVLKSSCLACGKSLQITLITLKARELAEKINTGISFSPRKLPLSAHTLHRIASSKFSAVDIPS